MNTAQLLLFEMQETSVRSYADSIMQVGTQLASVLWSGQKIKSQQVRGWMNKAFGGSDADGIWGWKDAYEAQECAIVLLTQQHRQHFQREPIAVMERLARLENLPLTQTIRSEESEAFQQFSTPPQLSYLASLCADLTTEDWVLEPQAGTGMLAQFARLKTAHLTLNELSDRRVSLLKRLFSRQEIFEFNAEQLNDLLPDAIQPTVVLMNPPFSATPQVNRRSTYTTVKHTRSAFARLRPGGRLVLISGSWFCPSCQTWTKGFQGLKDFSVRWTAAVRGNAYYKHGTVCDTRITVIDKTDMSDPLIETELVMSRQLFDFDSEWVELPTFAAAELEKLQTVPPRAIVESLATSAPTIIQQPAAPQIVQTINPAKPRQAVQSPRSATRIAKPEVAKIVPFNRHNVKPLKYRLRDVPYQAQETDGIYAVYQPQRLEIPGAKPHPSVLCEATALHAVLPPVPTYIPQLPVEVVEQGLLSEVQLECVIYAGQAHSQFLNGYYLIEDNWEKLTATTSDTPNAARFRTGYCNGNGTGSGKGREIAGVILDNFCQGRTKAVWVSRSDKLLKDARRDWAHLGGQESDVFPLSDVPLGHSISRSQGILFVSYATLRSVSKVGKPSRLKQIVEWLGNDFKGALCFDEAHALKNASTLDSEDQSGQTSQQGRAGLKLQRAVPGARVLYVSATMATSVANTGYQERLGLHSTGDFPFTSQADLIWAIEKGGVAAMEMLCRDLKSLGLYHAHNLSFEGVEYEPLEVELTPEQVAMYNTYAEAFQVIHHNLEEALRLCKVEDLSGKTLNKNAKRAAKSLFESTKQRFFNHLLSSVKCLPMIKSIEADLARGEAAVIQLVSTCEELMERRLAEIPPEQHQNLTIDITPREYVMHYLQNAFPVQLYEEFSTEDDKVESKPILDKNGDPVLCKEAIALRDDLIRQLAHLPPLGSALDQILHHFGADKVAEVTGRSRRVLCERDTGRLYVASRPASSNVAEVQAFMNDEKQILVFSDAGSTGESYHASSTARNQRKRNHYIAEAGWIADRAVQSLGRTHRTNEVHTPLYRLVTTNVRGERRFISTIARRLDSLGAMTKGQRRTGGQNLFDPRDNLESPYAAAALRRFYMRLASGQTKGHSLAEFERYSGLKLRDGEGRLKDELPKMATFLNRLLALKIELQNSLFLAFEEILDMVIESAKASGTFEVGVETIRAEHLLVVSQQSIHKHPVGGTTTCAEIERKERNTVLSVEQALRLGGDLLVNRQSHRAAVCLPTTSMIDDQGAVIRRWELVRPAHCEKHSQRDIQLSQDPTSLPAS